MAHVFVAYVRPILECACQLWSPSTVQLINRVDRAQSMFTKSIHCIANLSYDECLHYLGLQRLEARHLYLDLMFLYKFNYSHLTTNDFNIKPSCLHNNRFVSLPSSNRIDNYFYTVCTVHL